MDRPLAPLRVARHVPSLLRLGLAQIRAVTRSSAIRREAAAIGVCDPESFSRAVDDLHRSYVTLVTAMFPLSSAIGPPLAALRSAGTLLEHASRHRTITAELADRRGELRRAHGAARVHVLERFLADFGHRGVYESDIARPRYRDDPATLADERPMQDTVDAATPTSAATSTRAATATAGAPGRRSPGGWLTLPIWWVAAKPMAARELLRHDAMRSFARIRSGLVGLAGRAVDAGRLRSVDDLWMLTADEVRRLDGDWSPDAEFWNERRARRDELDGLDVPHVVRRFDDPADWNDEGAAAHDGVWRGLSLTTGRVSGRAWVLDEPAGRPPDGFDPASTILVARSIDAGWISTIADVAAVVVEIGGDLSHGSILVRELGVPAVTNASGVTRQITTGDELNVDAGAGTIRRT